MRNYKYDELNLLSNSFLLSFELKHTEGQIL